MSQQQQETQKTGNLGNNNEKTHIENQFNFTNSEIKTFNHNDGQNNGSTEQTIDSVTAELIYKIDRCCVGLHKNEPDANEILEVVNRLTVMGEQRRFMTQGNSMQRQGMNDRAMFYYICALKLAVNWNQIQDAMVEITKTAEKIGLTGAYFHEVIVVCQPADRDHRIYWEACIAFHTAQYCYDHGDFVISCHTATEAYDSLIRQYRKEIIQEYEVYCRLLILRAQALHKQKNYKEASKVLREAGEVVQLVTNWTNGNEDKCKSAVAELKKNQEYDNQSGMYN